MIDMHLKYDNMHINGTFNASIFINNHINSCINFMLSVIPINEKRFLRVYKKNKKLGGGEASTHDGDGRDKKNGGTHAI